MTVLWALYWKQPTAYYVIVLSIGSHQKTGNLLRRNFPIYYSQKPVAVYSYAIACTMFGWKIWDLYSVLTFTAVNFRDTWLHFILCKMKYPRVFKLVGSQQTLNFNVSVSSGERLRSFLFVPNDQGPLFWQQLVCCMYNVCWLFEPLSSPERP